MESRETESSVEALAWVEAGERFDLALVDHLMPELDGLALTEAIHRARPTDGPAVIILSSVGHRVARENEDVAFLTKPVKPSALHDAIVTALTPATPERPARRAAAKDERRDAQISLDRRLHILVAEDNAVNQKLAMRLLERLGYAADLATNGLEAIAAIEQKRYDVVFMDVQMPELDGLEATRRIVARWDRAHRPTIVAMTANAMDGDREMCLAAGMDDYLSKPIRPEELAAALDRAADERQAAAQGAGPERRVEGRAATAQRSRARSSGGRPKAGAPTGPRSRPPTGPPSRPPTRPRSRRPRPPRRPARMAPRSRRPRPPRSERAADDRRPDQRADRADAPIDGPTIDRLLESVGGDESFLDELTEAYLADAPVHLAAIRRALDAGSAEDLVRPAHTLKSSSATVGALVLSGYARELELDARGGSVAGGEERLAAAEAEFGRVSQGLSELRTARWRTTGG